MFSMFSIELQRGVIPNSRFWSGKKFDRRSLTIVKFKPCIDTTLSCQKNARMRVGFASFYKRQILEEYVHCLKKTKLKLY